MMVGEVMNLETKDVLKSLRKSNGFTTMQEFCEASGISFSTYQNYETGKRIPTAEILIKLADFYGVTTDYLLGREPAPNPFAELNLSEEDEANVVAKYMSLPPEIRACMLDVLVQLGDAAKKRQPEPDPDDTDYITVSTTLGEIEDRRKEDANSKDGV